MTSTEFLTKVTETVATNGHRGNKHFKQMASTANQALYEDMGRSDEPPESREVHLRKAAVNAELELKAGLCQFKSGHAYHDLATEGNYRGLLRAYEQLRSC